MTESAAKKNSINSHPLLIEIGCEELPPKALDKLRAALFTGVCKGLKDSKISFTEGDSHAWSTPRRLALFLADVATQQPDLDQERRGPAVAAAFDDDGQATPAAHGFARSVGTTVEALKTVKTDQGEWLYCRMQVTGKPLSDVLESVLQQALRQLPVPKPMRWSDNEFSFIRPVHWLVILHGDKVLPLELLGQKADRLTKGHRIHAPGPHKIRSADDYLDLLERSYVLADQQRRQELIRQGLERENIDTLIDPGLLAEVNNLVEWPVAVSCSFDEVFLEVPHQALIASMQDHQKFFPVLATDPEKVTGSSSQAISNQFVAVANLESRDFDAVRQGYERVIRPRLADARFFLEQDQKRPLDSYVSELDRVVYQKKIGTIGDKTMRMIAISRKIADVLDQDPDAAPRAARLAKCDLVTQMVGEFPELQGTMGRHYALASGETIAVSEAIGEHYAPRFAGDGIPQTVTGQIVSIADRIDTLVGIFAAGLKPTGNKDPFALRRVALGLVRILLEARLELSLTQLLTFSAEELSRQLDVATELPEEIGAFILQRSRHHFQEMGFSTDLINAAINTDWTSLPDLYARLEALTSFIGSEEGTSLAAANKRMGNIIKKSDLSDFSEIDVDRLVLGEEKHLFDELVEAEKLVFPLLDARDYSACLASLATLRGPVDEFFNQVMVMDEDPAIRANRLALLHRLKSLFDQLADLSVLA